MSVLGKGPRSSTPSPRGLWPMVMNFLRLRWAHFAWALPRNRGSRQVGEPHVLIAGAGLLSRSTIACGRIDVGSAGRIALNTAQRTSLRGWGCARKACVPVEIQAKAAARREPIAIMGMRSERNRESAGTDARSNRIQRSRRNDGLFALGASSRAATVGIGFDTRVDGPLTASTTGFVRA